MCSIRITEEYLQLQPGYGQTKARIHYRFPDHPLIINPLWLMWEYNDAYPDFPRLNEYLAWWKKEIEGEIAFVTVAHTLLLKKTELRCVDGVYTLRATRH